MKPREDLTGKKFNRLTVLKRNGSRDGHRLWLCQCDCGNEYDVISSRLTSSKTKSCGCLAKEQCSKTGLGNAKNPYITTGTSVVANSYRNSAKRRGFCWGISNAEFDSLIKKNCFYCDLPPSGVIKRKSGNLLYTGIDRIDTTKGYTIDNCVPCCKYCNRAKSDKSYADFLTWADLVYTRLVLNKSNEKKS